MSIFRNNKVAITVEHITGRGVKTKRHTFTKSPVNRNVYDLHLNPSEYIRVTLEKK